MEHLNTAPKREKSTKYTIYVKDIVRVSKNIEDYWVSALWPFFSVKYGTRNVKEACCNEEMDWNRLKVLLLYN